MRATNLSELYFHNNAVFNLCAASLQECSISSTELPAQRFRDYIKTTHTKGPTFGLSRVRALPVGVAGCTST